MNLTPDDLIADWSIFDNKADVQLERFLPQQDGHDEAEEVEAILLQTGEQAGLISADTNAADSASIDGNLTRILLRTLNVAKFSRITYPDGTKYVVVSSTKLWSVYSDCQCRDGV